jgi:hypothetical protein
MQRLMTRAFDHKEKHVVDLAWGYRPGDKPGPPVIMMMLKKKKYLDELKLSKDTKEKLAERGVFMFELPADWLIQQMVVDDTTGLIAVKHARGLSLVNLETLQSDKIVLQSALCGMAVADGRLFAIAREHLLIMDLCNRTVVNARPTSIHNYVTDHWLNGQFIDNNTVMLTHPETLSYADNPGKSSALAARRGTDAIVIRWAGTVFSGVYVASDIIPSCSRSGSEIVVQHVDITVACPLAKLRQHYKNDEFNGYIAWLAGSMRERVKTAPPPPAAASVTDGGAKTDISAALVDECTLATLSASVRQITPRAIAVGNNIVLLIYERDGKYEMVYVPRGVENSVFIAQEIAASPTPPDYALITRDCVDIYYGGRVDRYKLKM